MVGSKIKGFVLMSNKKNNGNSNGKNFFEQLLQGLFVRFNPQERTLTLRLPKADESYLNDKFDSIYDVLNDSSSSQGPHVPPEEIEILEDNLSIDTLTAENNVTRVKVSTKAYIKLALHALKYANNTIPKQNWVEVIGLLTGNIERRDTPLACLNITDAYPIGHGTDVTVQINDPQSTVRVYQDLKKGRINSWLVP